ncbi:MAG TPA: hypothetical protein VFC19_51690 [Candidatus Limnocylindrales bacterium]|nr:hypothetical protein [Candidatus Limnocylindrales bacterium]
MADVDSSLRSVLRTSWREAGRAIRRLAVAMWSAGISAAAGVYALEVTGQLSSPFLTNLLSGLVGGLIGVPLVLLVFQRIASKQTEAAQREHSRRLVLGAITRLEEVHQELESLVLTNIDRVEQPVLDGEPTLEQRASLLGYWLESEPVPSDLPRLNVTIELLNSALVHINLLQNELGQILMAKPDHARPYLNAVKRQLSDVIDQAVRFRVNNTGPNSQLMASVMQYREFRTELSRAMRNMMISITRAADMVILDR